MVNDGVGKYCINAHTLYQSTKSFDKHLVNDDFFQLIRVITENDRDFEVAKAQDSNFKQNMCDYGGIPILFCVYAKNSDVPPIIRTFDDVYFELDSDNKSIKELNMKFETFLGKPRYMYYHIFGTEAQCFEKLGYEFV